MVSKAIIEKVEETLAESKDCSNEMFRLVDELMVDSKKVEERCLRASDGMLCCSKKEKVKSGKIIWKGS